MMYSSLIQTLGKKRHTEADVVLVMNEVRIYLERENLVAQCAALKFYCDWIFHYEINRNYYTHFLIGEVNRFLLDTSIMFRLGLPHGEELSYGMHMPEMIIQLKYVLYKMIGKDVGISLYFWILYYRYIKKRLVQTKPDYPEKIRGNRLIYKSAADIQKEINTGNTYTNNLLKYISSTRLSPTTDYSAPLSIWMSNIEVKEVIDDTIIFELHEDKEEEGFTIIYEMHMPGCKQPVFNI